MAKDKDRAQKMRDLINKAAGKDISYNLANEDPTKVTRWLPTGSRWLDSIISSRLNSGGVPTGIPVGRIVEIAGLESTGKTYLAAQLAVRAQQQGFDVVWFDGEYQISPEFLGKMGMDLNALNFIIAWDLETVFESIEGLLGFDDVPKVFIIDSIAATPTKDDIAGGFDPNSNIAKKARILARSLSKLTTPLGDHGSTLLALNQLKDNISTNPGDRGDIMIDPYISPGGKAFKYHASLRIYLMKRKGKKHFIYDDDGEKVGSHVRALIKKSRFGTEGRSAEFKILWRGDEIKICDEESWLEALKKSPRVETGTWWTLTGKDLVAYKFQSATFVEKLEKDEAFKTAVLETLDECLIK